MEQYLSSFLKYFPYVLAYVSQYPIYLKTFFSFTPKRLTRTL